MANLCSGRGRAQQRRDERQERRDDRRERLDARRQEARQRAEERKLERHSISNEHRPLRDAVRGLLCRSNHTSGNHARGDTQHQAQTQRMNTTMNQDGSVTASLTLPRGVRPEQVILQAKVNINGTEQTYPVRLARGKANTEFYDRRTQEKFCKISSSRQADGSQRYTVDLYKNVSEATIRMQGHATQTINACEVSAEQFARQEAKQPAEQTDFVGFQETAPQMTSPSKQDNDSSPSGEVGTESGVLASSENGQQESPAAQDLQRIQSFEENGLEISSDVDLLELFDSSDVASLNFFTDASTTSGEQTSLQSNSAPDSSAASEQPTTDNVETPLSGLKVENPDLRQQIQTTEATSNSRPTAYTNSSLLRNGRLIFDRATLSLKPEQSVPSLQDLMRRSFRIE